MREVHVVDNAGQVGYVSQNDRRGFELFPQAWTEMNSVRMDEGAVEPGWGYGATGMVLSDDYHALEYMSNTDGDENWYVTANDSEISIWYNNVGVYTKEQIGSGYTGFFEQGDTWIMARKDGHLVLTNNVDSPQMIVQDDRANVVSTGAQDLAGFTDAPSLGQEAYKTCKTIIAFRGFLVAGSIVFQNGGRRPQMIAWSDRTDTGTLPGSWDYADPASLAGNVTLPADYGDIVALKEIRDELMIYCERGAYRMQWTGGQYVFRIVSAYDTVGAINPRAICSTKGTHVIVTNTDIVRTDGQYPTSIANGTVRKELFDQLSPANDHKIQVIEYPKKSEVIIICPDKQDGAWCGKVLAWNWITETWAVRRGLLLRCMANVPRLVSAVDPENAVANSTYDEIWRTEEGITDGTTTPPADQQLQEIPPYQFDADYTYVAASSGSAAHDGWIIHSKINTNLYSMKISKTDYHGADRSADLASLLYGSTITVTPFSDTTVWTIDVIEDQGTWIYVEVSPPGFLDPSGYNEDTFSFETAGSKQIESMPADKDFDNYSVQTATYGTILADEGVLYMVGIGAIPETYEPNTAQENTNSLWLYDGLVNSYQHNAANSRAPYVERRGINLTSDQTVQIVTAIYPKMEGINPVMVRVGAVDFIGGQPDAIRWDPPVLFDPESNYRITCRVAGRRHAIRFEAVPVDVEEGGADFNTFSNFRLTGYDLEYSQTGRR